MKLEGKHGRVRSAIAGLLSMLMFASVVTLATQADGREATLAESNDGGAWLVDRLKGGIAHVERSSRLPTVSVNSWEPRSGLSAMQAPGVIAIVDASSSKLTLIDSANAIELSTLQLTEQTEAHTIPNGVVLFDRSDGRIWNRTVGELAGLSDLRAEPPDLAVEGRLVASTMGDVAIIGDETVTWPYAGNASDSNSRVDPSVWDIPDGFGPDHITMAGRQLVLVDGDRWLVGTADGFQVMDGPKVATIAAPSAGTDVIGYVRADGNVGMTKLSTGESFSLGALGPANTNPVMLGDCVFVLSGPAGEVNYGTECQSGNNKNWGALNIGTDAQLRVVNGYVWVDALDGSGYVVSSELELHEIASFSTVFDDAEPDDGADGENTKEVLDQGDVDASLTNADERTDDDDNEPPLAVDDEAATRGGRQVFVDVLYNDSDPDSDVILVESVEQLSGDAAGIIIPTSRNGVQITPPNGATELTFRYTISDGHPGGTDSAVITLDVLPLTQDNNRPPLPGLDRAVGAAGAVVSLNLLLNDTDPDGDSLVLVSLTSQGDSTADSAKVISIHPGGDVLVTLPTELSEGTVFLDYVVRDEWQGEAEGVLQLELRIENSNEPPDARNDSAVTQVGRAVTLNLLDNDADSDNDLLSIGQQALPLNGEEPGGLYQTTEDGEFFFEPSRAGTFVFEYSATDSRASNLAIVRVEVSEPQENRPPIAVRDDITLVLGETRLVRALDNDGDPDGDLFASVEATDNENLKIVDVPGVGFWVTLNPSAGATEPFWYRLSDGLASSELALVMVTRSDQAPKNAAPIANDDVVRLRAGRSSWINAIGNDYDPEGGPLTIIEVNSTEPSVAPSIGSQQQSLTALVPNDLELPFSLTYIVVDDVGNKSVATVYVSIVPADEENAAPIARPDTAYTKAEQAVLIPVLLNDSDPESDAFTVIGVPQSPLRGAAEFDEDTKLYTYTPAPGFVGTDQFTYLLRDSQGAESTGHVSIAVMPIPALNRDPIAQPDSDYIFSAGAGAVMLAVLDNDSDPDGDQLTIIDATGTAALIASNGRSISFPVPATAPDRLTLGFTYEISDGRGGTDRAEVIITVLADEEDPIPPVPPIANPDTAGPVREGETASVNVLSNDEDPDGDVSLLVVSTNAPGATVIGNQLSILAPAESAEFSYSITDPDGLSDQSFVTLTVEPNLPPIVSSPNLGEFFTDESIPVVNLAEYVIDPDGDDLVFSSVSSQIGGTTRLAKSGADSRTVTFIPSEDFRGDAGFAFTVEDGHGHTVTGRVNLTLKGRSNQPPVGQDTTITIEAGIAQPIDFSALFSDPDDGDTLTYEITTAPKSPVVLEAQGADAVRVNTDITSAAGQSTLVVQATDSEGETARATVTIQVTAASSGPPEAKPDSGKTTQGQAITVDVLSNDINTLGTGNLTIINAFSPDGSAVINGANITFTPSSGFFGSATVTYTISDERNRSEGEAIGLLTVDVVGQPDAPVGLAAKALPPRSIGVTWTSPANNGAAIDRFEIELDGSINSVGTNPSHNFNDLEPGVDHIFRVRAVNEAGEGQWSGSVTASVDQAPPTPGRPAAAISDPGQLVVTWPEVSAEGSAILGYNLEIGQCGNQTKTLIAGTTNTWTGLTNGVRCTFRVSATNKAGDSQPSDWSDPVCPVSVETEPGKPTVVRGDKQVEVAWAPPTSHNDCGDGGAGSIISYEIVRSPALTTPVPAGTVHWVSAPLQNGQTYTYQVRAENRAGWTALSEPSDPVTPCGVPLAPSTPTAVRGDTLATVTYSTDADDNGCAISQYEVSANGGSWQQLVSGGNIGGLTNGTEYTFRVRGINDIGEGEPSVASNAVIPIGPPSAVTNLRYVTVGNGFGYWYFQPADRNGSENVEYHYAGNLAEEPMIPPDWDGNGAGGQIICSTAEDDACELVSSFEAYPPNCWQPVQIVSATIWASNEIGVGPTRTTSQSLPGCPSAPSLQLTAGDGEFNASWSRPANTDRLYIQIGADYGSPIGGSSAVIEATNGVSYTLIAWACNGFGCASSGTRTVMPVDPTPPTISLTKSGTGPAGYWYQVQFSGFQPGQTVSAACHDSVDSSFWTQSFTMNGSGAAGDTTLCYSADGPAHWVTAGGVTSNTVNW